MVFSLGPQPMLCNPTQATSHWSKSRVEFNITSVGGIRSGIGVYYWNILVIRSTCYLLRYYDPICGINAVVMNGSYRMYTSISKYKYKSRVFICHSLIKFILEIFNINQYKQKREYLYIFALFIQKINLKRNKFSVTFSKFNISWLTHIVFG